MEQVLAALADQHAELEGLIGGLDADGWRRPSPCEGWDVADVVTHLSQTDEMALASAQGRFAEFLEVLASGLEGAGGVDEGADALVVKERGRPDAEVTKARRARLQEGLGVHLRRDVTADAPVNRDSARPAGQARSFSSRSDRRP